MSMQSAVAAAIDRLVQAINAVDAKTGGGGTGAGAAVHAKEPGLATGMYVSQQINASAFSTIAAAANRLELFPFIPAIDITINALATEVSTAAAGGLGRLGIYSSLANGNPGAKLVEGATSFTTDATGLKELAVANTLLSAGSIYWLAILSSSGQTYRGIPLAALQSLGMNASLNTSYSLRRATSTFANGLPANAPATTLTSAITPLFRLKIA